MNWFHCDNSPWTQGCLEIGRLYSLCSSDTLSFSISLRPSISLCLCLPLSLFCLSGCLPLSVSLFLYQSLSLSLSVCMNIHSCLSVCLSLYSFSVYICNNCSSLNVQLLHIITRWVPFVFFFNITKRQSISLTTCGLNYVMYCIPCNIPIGLQKVNSNLHYLR